MENRTILVEQKIKNIQSDYGSADFEAAKKFHNHLIPKIIENAREFGANDLPHNGEYDNLLIARYNALYTELIADETTMAEEVRACFIQAREDYFKTSEGHLSCEITRIKQEFEKAKRLHGRVLGETDASNFLINRTWVVYLVLIVMGLLELPLNFSVFAPLSISKTGTYMLALLLVAVVPVLAHFCGKFFKQRKELTSNLVLGIGIALLLLALTMFLSSLRYLYFEAKAIEPQYDTFQEAYKAVQMGLKPKDLILSPVFWTSFLFNFGLIATGFLLSFLSHDSRDSFEKSYKALVFKRPKLIDQLSQLRKSQYTNFTIQGNGSKTPEQKLLQNMTEYRRMHDTLSKHVENLAVFIDGLCKEAINEFRLHNQKSRKDIASIPRHWHDEWYGFQAVLPKLIKTIFSESYPELEPAAVSQQ